MLINCPKCGAGNKQGARTCRMCAEYLTQAEAPPPANPPPKVNSQLATVVFPDLKTRPVTMMTGEKRACPSCSATNELGWLFCQQCGKKLEPSAVTESAPAATENAPAAEDTPPPTPSRADEIARAEAFLLENPETVILPVTPEPPPPAQAQPPTAAPATPPAPVQPPPSSPDAVEVPVHQPVSPAPGQQARQAEQTQPAGQGVKPGFQCVACGHMDSAGGIYCSACGAPRSVPQTVVMSSVQTPPPAAGRLRLIVDGGDTETIYELKDETVIGRQKGDLQFAHDGFMSDTHARIVRRGDEYVLIDEESRNGVYIRIKDEARLTSGDYILLGRQLFCFQEHRE